MADIVFVAKFVQSNSKSFSEYIDYMKRSEAVTIEQQHTFSKYSEYMSNHEKTTGLFDYFNNNLTSSQIKRHQKAFEHAQEEGGMMWQQVISFTPEFLEENNISVGGVIDDDKLKEVTRKVMTQQLKDEEMLSNVCWNAAIHYNTDNIHIHIAFVEKNPSRERGKIKQSTFEKAKSSIYHQIVDKTKELHALNEQKKQIILGAKDMHGAISYGAMIQKLSGTLPTKGRMQYNSTHITEEQRKQIDECITKLLETSLLDEYQKYTEQLQEETLSYEKAFGVRKHDVSDYKQNKEQELYGRIGNMMLEHVKEYRELERSLAKADKNNNKKSQQEFATRVRFQKMMRKALQEQMKTCEIEMALADQAILGG